MSVQIPYTNQFRIINFPQRQRIAINGFCRVNKYRRCRVCKKPDWCGYTTDEQTSICMRISNGSKATSRNGGNIFHHNRLFFVASLRTDNKLAPPPIEIAPIEIRNAVFDELIRWSNESGYNLNHDTTSSSISGRRWVHHCRGSEPSRMHQSRNDTR